MKYSITIKCKSNIQIIEYIYEYLVKVEVLEYIK